MWTRIYIATGTVPKESVSSSRHNVNDPFKISLTIRLETNYPKLMGKYEVCF